MAETTRQKFIRNSGERERIMECAAVECERSGDDESAGKIRAMIERWKEWRRKAEEDEANGK